MPGFVEVMSATRVKGWAHDPDRKTPATVRVVLNQAVVAECVADLPRADVAKALKSTGLHGFDIALNGKVTAADLPNLQVLASSGAEWKPLKIFKGKKAPPRGSYQDFDGSGASASNSHEKLKALRLGDLPRTDRYAAPLRGKSLLDLGCNEGFFCAEAVRQGASRVVGIDFKQTFIESARRRCPEATFIQATWWDIPDEKFDCILFLSGIHYEPEQKKLLRKLREHLAPDGVLVLECGVFVEGGVRAWRSVKRWDGVRRYPTMDLLKRDLLEGYAVRPAGRSVDQKGDPVPRYVFHCTAHSPIAMIVAAPSLSGKTILSFQLESRGIPVYSTDLTIARLVMHADQEWRPLAQRLRERFAADQLPNMAQAALYIVDNKLEDELCEIIANETPAEANIFCIQGDALRHASIQDALKQKLVARNIRPWLVKPF